MLIPGLTLWPPPVAGMISCLGRLNSSLVGCGTMLNDDVRPAYHAKTSIRETAKVTANILFRLSHCIYIWSRPPRSSHGSACLSSANQPTSHTFAPPQHNSSNLLLRNVPRRHSKRGPDKAIIL